MKLITPPSTVVRICLIFLIVLFGAIFSFPVLLALNIQHEQKQAISVVPEQFPVTVDPRNKIIIENEQVNAFFEKSSSPFQAAIVNVKDTFGKMFELIALSISNAPWYQSIAAVDSRFVTIDQGMRKEQVANAFAKAISWNNNQKQEFLDGRTDSPLNLQEGLFSPGIYTVAIGMKPLEARAMVDNRFYKNVLSHYGTTTISVVPLDQALTIASLIEREAGGHDDRRVISGIIWNRLFIGMNLQIDATLQYAKANDMAIKSWWPDVVPSDIFRASPYNTYMYSGLPPTPISNPSVASILAALNPRNTSCLFYFHDDNRQFHCSDTYKQHVALLKKYYGRGR